MNSEWIDVLDKKIKHFLKKKNIEISAKRYFIDALGAMAQGLFASLLIGTILSTLGQQIGVPVLEQIGGFASSVKVVSTLRSLLPARSSLKRS